MNPIILSDIPFRPDTSGLLKQLRIGADSDEAETVFRLAEQAATVAHPRAMYGLAFVEAAGDDTITIDGVTFKSRVLRVNLDGARKVYPFIATCGMELEMWANGITDPFERYCAEGVKQMALGAAIAAMSRHLDALYSPGDTSTMNPGSLADWPLAEQRKLFAVCGDPQAAIGVSLTKSLLMVPTKSVSGIRFASAERFENCALCPRVDCPGRRAPYDQALFDRKYRQADADSATCAECGNSLTAAQMM